MAQASAPAVLQELKESACDADANVGREIISSMGEIGLLLPSAAAEVVGLVRAKP